MRLPRLVLVTGAPGSGKTTLARYLAAALGLPLVSRDGLKEALWDALGGPDPGPTREGLLRAQFDVYDALVRCILEAGDGVVAEDTGHADYAPADLAPLVAISQAALVYCDAPAAVCYRRFEARYSSHVRHPCHHDHRSSPGSARARTYGRRTGGRSSWASPRSASIPPTGTNLTSQPS